MLQTLPPSARDYSRRQRLEIEAAVAAVKTQWAKMGDDFDMSWARQADQISKIVGAAQKRIVAQSLQFLPDVLEDTGQVAPEVATVRGSAMFGITGSGRGIPDVLSSAPVRAKQAVGRGLGVDVAKDVGSKWLQGTVGTILSDSGRAIEAVGAYARPDIHGFVRILSPPSCGRCVILAGKRFRLNDGFQRHPRCDCRHLPSTDEALETMSRFLTDPDEHFHQLGHAAQAKLAGSHANARAIREGADFGQIVNAYGPKAGVTLAQGGVKITRQGMAAGVALRRIRAQGITRTVRIMPETIYKHASSPAEALHLLKRNGWLDESIKVPKLPAVVKKEALQTAKKTVAKIGIPKRETLLSRYDDVFWSNPHRGDPIYANNCGNCVTTYELRRRGYMVKAAPTPSKGKTGIPVADLEDRWRTPEGNVPQFVHTPGGLTGVGKVVETWPEGARGILYVRWKGAGAHVVNVEKVGGKMEITDPQIRAEGPEDLADLRARSRSNEFRLMRTDHLIEQPSAFDAVDETIR